MTGIRIQRPKARRQRPEPEVLAPDPRDREVLRQGARPLRNPPGGDEQLMVPARSSFAGEPSNSAWPAPDAHGHGDGLAACTAGCWRRELTVKVTRTHEHGAEQDTRRRLRTIAKATALTGGPGFLLGVLLHPARDGAAPRCHQEPSRSWALQRQGAPPLEAFHPPHVPPNLTGQNT